MPRLRIISGRYGGRFIKAPDGRTTHPMGDRVRSALFNMVDVDGKNVLDAYAGTGAVGLEALSHGAAHVDFIENDKRATRAIEENIAVLDVDENAKLYKMGVSTFLSSKGSNPLSAKYDIIFADPPYDKLSIEIISGLTKLLSPGGLFVLSWPSSKMPPRFDTVKQIVEKKYAQASIVIYQ